MTTLHKKPYSATCDGNNDYSGGSANGLWPCPKFYYHSKTTVYFDITQWLGITCPDVQMFWDK